MCGGGCNGYGMGLGLDCREFVVVVGGVVVVVVLLLLLLFEKK